MPNYTTKTMIVVTLSLLPIACFIGNSMGYGEDDTYEPCLTLQEHQNKDILNELPLELPGTTMVILDNHNLIDTRNENNRIWILLCPSIPKNDYGWSEVAKDVYVSDADNDRMKDYVDQLYRRILSDVKFSGERTKIVRSFNPEPVIYYSYYRSEKEHGQIKMLVDETRALLIISSIDDDLSKNNGAGSQNKIRTNRRVTYRSINK